jgi:phosphoglycolate phosphatase
VPAGVRTIRGLVFDKDGTLFDFHRTWAGWCAALIRDLTAGQPEKTQALAAAFGFDLQRQAFRKSSPVIAGTMEVMVRAIRGVLPETDEAALRAELVRSAAEAPQVEAVPLRPLLDRLRGEGFTLGIATNDAEVPARAHLGAAGVLDRFAFVAGYDSGHGMKPGTGMLEAFCRATSLAPADCAMIGDSSHDLVSGRAAGMTTVAVLTGIAEADDLAHLADAVLRDIGGLPFWLGLEGAQS